MLGFALELFVAIAHHHLPCFLHDQVYYEGVAQKFRQKYTLQGFGFFFLLGWYWGTLNPWFWLTDGTIFHISTSPSLMSMFERKKRLLELVNRFESEKCLKTDTCSWKPSNYPGESRNDASWIIQNKHAYDLLLDSTFQLLCWETPPFLSSFCQCWGSVCRSYSWAAPAVPARLDSLIIANLQVLKEGKHVVLDVQVIHNYITIDFKWTKPFL